MRVLDPFYGRGNHGSEITFPQGYRPTHNPACLPLWLLPATPHCLLSSHHHPNPPPLCRTFPSLPLCHCHQPKRQLRASRTRKLLWKLYSTGQTQTLTSLSALPHPILSTTPHPAFSPPGPRLNVLLFQYLRELELLQLFFPFSPTLLRNKEHLAPLRLIIPNHCLNQDGNLHSMGAPVWSISCQFLPFKVPAATYPAFPGSKAGPT